MKTKPNTFPLDTEIEVWATGKGKRIKKIMSYEDALNMKKVDGFRYENFQIGFCSYEEIK